MNTAFYAGFPQIVFLGPLVLECVSKVFQWKRYFGQKSCNYLGRHYPAGTVIL